MHTSVMFDKVDKDGSLIFEANADIFNGFITINVQSFSQETLTLKVESTPNSFADIFTVSYVVAGCFHPDSNLYGVKRIIFTLDGITISITEKDATPEKIEKIYYEERKKLEAIYSQRSITMATWKSIDNPPKKDGRYIVKFKFYLRHETDQIEIAYREFNNGNWNMPYYNNPFENSKFIAWLDEEEG